MTNQIQCHYEILGVEPTADGVTIKKSHRKMALKYHPDKNLGDDSAAEKFRLVQQAYECLSDAQERKWYDDHRDAILAGWTASSDNDNVNMLFEVVHFMHPGCYSGYHNDNGGFFEVYTGVFENIFQCEKKQSEKLVELPTDFGTADSDWTHVQQFYQTWESFGSLLNFAWEDKYNVHEDAPNRRVRRLMEDDNKKARRKARKTYNDDILALVAFVKRRDPRVKAKQQEIELEKLERERRRKEEVMERKREQQQAKEAWQEEARREMEEAEEADRIAGRVRLADLEDDYDYVGGKKGRKGKKKKNKNRSQEMEEDQEDDDEPSNATVEGTVDGTIEQPDDDGDSLVDEIENDGQVDVAESDELSQADAMLDQLDQGEDEQNDLEEWSEESESEEEPDVWRCECCRKDFKSEGQMENHMKSKKHKEQFKKYETKMKKQEEKLMAEMMDELNV